MSKFDIFLLALKNFRRRMMRSILTIIGVVIGTLAIIVMVSLGIGMQESMTMMFEQWGDLTTVNVDVWQLGQDGGGGGGGIIRMAGGSGSVMMETATTTSNTPGSNRRRNEPNPFHEARANIEALNHVETAMLTRSANVRLVSGRYATLWASITLVDTSRLHYFGFSTSQGRMLQPGDEDFAIVLSPHVGEQFVNVRVRDPWDWNNQPPRDEEGFAIPFVDVFNDEIQLTFNTRHGERPLPGETRRRAQLHDLQIVGFQEEMGRNSWTSFMDEEVFEQHQRAYFANLMRNMPPEEQENFRWQLEQMDRYDQMIVKVDHRDNVVDVIQEIRNLGLEAWGQMEWIDEVDAQMLLIQLVMGAIGAVALLVAAINIANTMIMSIYERTKEIGIMKVIGCRLGDIGLLFILEAIILGIIGGLIGIGASFGISALLNNLPPDIISSIFGGFWIDPEIGASVSVIPFWLVLLSLAISVGVAVLAGLYPSIRAMRLSALEAIRNE